MKHRTIGRRLQFAWLKELSQRQEEQRLLGDGALYRHPESLSFYYAEACRQVALNLNPSIRPRYLETIAAWGRPDCLEAMNEFFTDILDINTWDDRMRQVKKHLARGDPGILISECTGWDDIYENHRGSTDFQFLIDRVCEFIKEGFNRESEKAEGIYKVVASLDVPSLFLDVSYSSCVEFCKFKLANWNRYGKVEIGGKVYDLEDIWRNKPTHDLHRRLVDAYQQCRWVLKHDWKLLKDAERWYKCRVDPGSIEAYLDQLADDFEQMAPTISHLPVKEQDRIKRKYFPDGGRVSNDIRPCDDATGYRR